MNKTFIYTCRFGENEELRYSLRSVDKFYPDAEVWVVGGKPEWYTGNYIEVKQSINELLAVKNNLAKVISNEDIPDEIIIMNDDFFFVGHMEKIPPYISGNLKDRIYFNRSNGFNSIYIKRLTDSYRHCKRFRNPPLDFDIHVPMTVSKQKLSLILDDDVMWRSNYGNRFINPKETIIIEDVKVYPQGRYEFKTYDYLSFKYPFFSTQDDSFEMVKENLLNNMFPNPSKYEISKSVF